MASLKETPVGAPKKELTHNLANTAVKIHGVGDGVDVVAIERTIRRKTAATVWLSLCFAFPARNGASPQPWRGQNLIGGGENGLEPLI